MKNTVNRTTAIVHWGLLCAIVVSAYSVWQLEQQLSQQYSIDQQKRYEMQQITQQQQAIVQLANDYPITLKHEDGQPVGLVIKDSLPLPEWQQRLTALQQALWMSPYSITWSRTGDHWSAEMSWRLHRPTTLNPEFNILPVALTKTDPPLGQLVSIIKDKHTAALFQLGPEQIWLREGAWHPGLQATLAKVEQNAVWLQGALGSPYKLTMGDNQQSTPASGGE